MLEMFTLSFMDGKNLDADQIFLELLVALLSAMVCK
jgi:hypothetical protein